MEQNNNAKALQKIYRGWAEDYGAVRVLFLPILDASSETRRGQVPSVEQN